MTDSTLENILERAIQSEEHSYNTYAHLAGKVDRPESKKLLEGLAQQELKHKELLEAFDLGAARDFKPEKIDDQKIAEFLTAAPLDTSASVQDVVLFAMKKEQAAYEFYARMGEFSPTAEIKSLFDRLAAEELKHKTTLETLYEDMFMREN